MMDWTVILRLVGGSAAYEAGLIGVLPNDAYSINSQTCSKQVFPPQTVLNLDLFWNVHVRFNVVRFWQLKLGFAGQEFQAGGWVGNFTIISIWTPPP